MMEIHDRQGNETCNEIVSSNLSKTAALKKLKPRNCTVDAKNVIISNTIARKDKLEEVHFKDSESKHSTFLLDAETVTVMRALQEVLCAI